MKMETRQIDIKTLAAAIRQKRASENLTLKHAEAESGVSGSTISRIEREIGKPDMRIIALLTDWLSIPPDRILGKDRAEAVIFYESESTPDIIAEHLRKDKNLSAKAADALSELFRVAYAQMREFQNGD